MVELRKAAATAIRLIEEAPAAHPNLTDAQVVLGDALRADAELQAAVAADRWSFPKGSLRERLVWAGAQHQREAEDPIGPLPEDQRRSFHLACVEWYADMVRQLEERGALEAWRQPLSEAVLLPEPQGEGWNAEIIITKADLHALLNRHAVTWVNEALNELRRADVSPSELGGTE